MKFTPFGIKGSLIAPAVQQVLSIAGEGDRTDVNGTQLDLFILKQSNDKKKYVLLDPQYVLDCDVPPIFVPVSMLEHSSMLGRSDLAGAHQ